MVESTGSDQGSSNVSFSLYYSLGFNSDFNRVSPADSCQLTLDPNTANTDLYLSEDNRTVTWREKQPYPDHPDRFDCLPQVLCRESLSSRCYWEVQWSGDGARIAVAYKGIRRKGGSAEGQFGFNDKSCILVCSGKNYSVIHNSKQSTIPITPSHTVGVYLDWPAGTLSFYRVSSGELTLLYRFTTTFKEPLCAGFRVWWDSSVTLSEMG
uniref:B30.2/SPRY domain-containing protein n=1 Tax=Scleropages formosus TaxID=113540 RepID=A0A8C9T9P2_SCLFO